MASHCFLWLQAPVLALSVLAAPPSIKPGVGLHSRAVYVGKTASLAVVPSETEPLSYQWRLGGRDISGQTSRTLTIAAAQRSDEGEYTVMVHNTEGDATSEPLRLLVVPSATDFKRRNFTNSAGFRLPYVYYVPADYRSDHAYPLVCNFHGVGVGAWSENILPEGFGDWPQVLALASYGRQATDPAIVVWPTRHAGTEATSWTSTEVGSVLELLDQLTTEFNIDTNRIYLGGASGGGAPVMDAVGFRTNFFAAAVTWSGIAGQTPVTVANEVPFWAFASAAEGIATAGRNVVKTLRAAGWHPIFTEYAVGSHEEAIRAGMACPAMVDWLLAQRRRQTTLPRLAITAPTDKPIWKTGARAVNLAGSAKGLGRGVAKVTWENTANKIKKQATGTDLWTANDIPLVSHETNIIVVTGTMETAWAPAYGGTTTFSETLTVISSP